MSRTYPAKILLFGEHTVLRGGRGLAIPYHLRSLRWVKDRPDERLLAFCDYLKVAFRERKLLDAGSLEDFLLDDWRLEGDIPTGYGLGSSGAVCAAIWDRFATPAGKFLGGEDLRRALARMEQHFHGSSSGTDPLICYLDRPVVLGGGQPPLTTNLPSGATDGFFLLDTGIERSASGFIREFTRRYDTDAGFARMVDNEWLMPANDCIDAALNSDSNRLRTSMRQLSEFQLTEMTSFIPAAYRDKWLSEDYILKLCGAGGGGMLLGFRIKESGVVEKYLGKVAWL